MLDRVADQFGPEDVLDGVEQPLVREHPEDRRADVERCLRLDVLLRQADVERLVEAPPRLGAQGQQPLRERHAGMGRVDGSLGDKGAGDPVEDLLPLAVDRVEVGVGVEDVLDDHEALLGELGATVCGRERHRWTLPGRAGIGSSDRTGFRGRCGSVLESILERTEQWRRRPPSRSRRRP